MNRQGSRGATPGLSAIAGLFLAIANGCAPSMPSANGTKFLVAPAAPALVSSPSPLPASAEMRNAPVKNISDREWERSLKAAYTVPLQARVVVSHWADAAGAKERRTVIDVVTAGGGRYRHTYLEPEAARGRIALSDGTTSYQYEPAQNAMLRRADPAEDAETLPITSPAHLRHVIQPGQARLLNRPTRLIVTSVVRSEAPAYVWERRWADIATGRSLKTEIFSPSGRLMRRVEMTQVSFPATIAAEIFQPDFPAATRLITATTPHSQDAVAAAARLGLPRIARGYRLRSALYPAAARSGPGIEPTTHLIYSDGARTLSVFITEDASAKGRTLTPQPGEGWRPVALTGAVAGFTRQNKEEMHNAIAWMSGNRRYTVVSRLPQQELIPLAAAFAAPPPPDRR